MKMTMVAPMTDDAELLRRYASDRTEDAFAELVRRYLDLVHSAALRQVGGNPASAADVTQAVFTELARHADRLTRHPALTGWLYTTTHRMAARHVRGEVRRQRREQEAHVMQELQRDTGPELDWARLRPVLDAAMHDLGETDRTAVLLRHFEQRPLAEVGSKLGLSENAARMRVERALDKLRTKLAKRGVTSTASALAVALTGQAVTAAPPTLVMAVTSAAVATAVTTTSTSGLLALMAYTKLQTAAAIALIAAIGTALVIQHIDTNRLHRSNVELERRLVLSGAELEATRSAARHSSNELARLRPLQEELMRLRGQITAAGSGTVHPVRPKSIPTAKDIDERMRTPIGILTDHGNATPEDASVSLLWALSIRQRERYIELIKLPDDLPAETKAWGLDYLYKNLGKTYGGLEFSSIRRGRTDDQGTRVYAAFKDPATGREDELVVVLREGRSGWQIVVDDLPREVPEHEQPAP